MTLKNILDSLPREKRQLLMYAFEHGLTQYVVLPEDRYIGVNVVKVPFLIPDLDLCRGVWSSGDYKGPK